MAKTSERQDQVDKFLASIRDELPPELDLTVEGIVDRISKLSKRLKRMMEESLAEYDLTWGEWKVLSYLRHQGGPYSCSPGRLAEHLELSSGAMTNRLDQLERAGAIRRLPDPSDRRGVQVQLTPAGQKLGREAIVNAAAKEALVVTALNQRERDQLNALLRRLMLAFDELHPGH